MSALSPHSARLHVPIFGVNVQCLEDTNGVGWGVHRVANGGDDAALGEIASFDFRRHYSFFVVDATVRGRAWYKLLDAPVPTLDVTVLGDHSKGPFFRMQNQKKSELIPHQAGVSAPKWASQEFLHNPTHERIMHRTLLQAIP